MDTLDVPTFTWIKWIAASYALADIVTAESALVAEIGKQDDLSDAVASIAGDLDQKLTELEDSSTIN